MADNPINCYYFGKLSKDSYNGHVLYSGNRVIHSNSDLPNDFPVDFRILDGGLLPPNLPQTQGRTELIHLQEWTIITFWDRTADTRGKSNSAFVIRGHLDFTEAIKVTKEHYPQIWERFKFEVYQR